MKIGDTVKIIRMDGEPDYDGKVGVVECIDDMGQFHGTWGTLAIQLNRDDVVAIKEA